MIQKDVYPHEYMASWGRFEGKKIQSKKAFYSKMNLKGISDNDHDNAEQVRNTMKKKTLGCYHDVNKMLYCWQV